MTRGVCLYSAFAVCMFLGGPAAAQDGQQPPQAEEAPVGHLVEKVPLNKKPSQVESYNKVRFTVDLRTSTTKKPDMSGNNQYKRLKEKLARLEAARGKEGVNKQIDDVKKQMSEMENARMEQEGAGTTFAIEGDAYYPDGAVVLILARYWKLERAFAQKRFEVKDHKISGEIGPIKRKIPRGKIAFECYFFLNKQSRAVTKAMEDGKYFSCKPPCRWDKIGFNRTWHEMGGDKAQAREEEIEKKEIKKALDALLAARTAGHNTFSATRKKQKDVQAAGEALERVKMDVRAVQRTWRTWLGTRAFPLFPYHGNLVESLASGIKNEAMLHAGVAGVKVTDDTRPNMDPAKYFAEYRERAVDVDKKQAELKGFLAEAGTLDRIWDELGESVKAKAKARAEAKEAN